MSAVGPDAGLSDRVDALERQVEELVRDLLIAVLGAEVRELGDEALRRSDADLGSGLGEHP